MSDTICFSLAEDSVHSYISSKSYLCTITTANAFECLSGANLPKQSILHTAKTSDSLITAMKFKLTAEAFDSIYSLNSENCTLKEFNTVASKAKCTSTSNSSTTCWTQHGDIQLSRRHKMQLLNGNELSDLHVNAFHNLARKQFSHVGGLQNTLLQSKHPITNPSARIILQIIHIRSSHWATLCVNGDDICLYDSAYSSLSEDTFPVIAQLVRYKKTIIVKIMNVAKQSGSVDCALLFNGISCQPGTGK